MCARDGLLEGVHKGLEDAVQCIILLHLLYSSRKDRDRQGWKGRDGDGEGGMSVESYGGMDRDKKRGMDTRNKDGWGGIRKETPASTGGCCFDADQAPPTLPSTQVPPRPQKQPH